MKKLLFLFVMTHLQSLSADWHTIYAHGILDNKSQINRFKQAISTNASAIEFTDAQSATDWSFNRCIQSICSLFLDKTINRANMHMGQLSDINTLAQKLQAVDQKDDIILYGCSRGAATILNTLAEYNPKNVQALVLDATPADMPATIKPFLAKIGINPCYALTIFQMLFPAYPTNCQTPLQAIANITNKNLPILLLHSTTDTKVPVQHSYQLYQEFKNQGFVNVELVIFSEGNHSYLLKNETIKPLYLHAVHSFYKKYNLPYDATWTQQDFEWKKYRPENTESLIFEYEKNLENMYQQTIKKYITATLIATTITTALLLNKHNISKL